LTADIEETSMTKLKMFSGKKGAIMNAIMNAIIPRGGAYGPGAADFDLLPRAEAYVTAFNPLVRMGFPILLRYVEYGALIRTGKRLTRLSDDEATAYLDTFEESRLYYRRTIALMLKMVTMLAFYDIDENAALIGYTHRGHVGGKKKSRAPGRARAKR
jgi:hypothetical protein